MTAPVQVREQADLVKKLQEEYINSKNAEAKPEGEPKEPVENTPPADPTPKPEVTDQPATILKEDYDKLEQRYRTLQGMHTADVSRFRTELEASRNDIQELKKQLATKEQPKKVERTPVKYVTDADESEYGDTLDMVRRAAREEAENLFAKQEDAYLEEIANLKSQLGQIQNTVVPRVEDLSRGQEDAVKVQFWTTMDTQVPNWRVINQDEGFRAWLLAEDPLTGATRQQYLTHAHNQYNAQRVIGFFKEWERIAGGQTPAPKKDPQAELAKLQTPGPSRGGNAPSNEKKKWTREEIRKFYQDKTMGVYASKPDEAKKMEADIIAAGREGRIS